MEAQLSAWHRSWMPRRETDLELDDETRKTTIDYRPVHYYTLDDEEQPVVAPVARVY